MRDPLRGELRCSDRVTTNRLIVLATVSAMTFLGLLAATGSAYGKVPGPNGQIAFSRFDPSLGDTVTYVVDPDGTHLRQVFPGASEAPHWSPDGSKIALVACADPPVCDTAAVIVDPNTGNFRVLTMPDPDVFTGCVLWSPDAKRLACEGFGQTDPSLNGIYSIRTSDGRGLTRITSNPGGDDIPTDYSPNGNKIVFLRSDPTRPSKASQAHFVAAVRGSGVHRITPWSASSDAERGSWSPDGRTILFGVGRSLFLVHPDGSGLRKLPIDTTGFSYPFVPSWSPDGSRIIFSLFTETSPGSGKLGIFTAKANGTDLRQVTDSPTNDEDGDWGPHPLAP